MPYNPDFAERIRQFFYSKDVLFSEKKMFSGLCFLVDDKMCCATHTNKNTGEELLLCRIGEMAYEDALSHEFVGPMNFTGKTMKGFVYVSEDGLTNHKELSFWLQKCLDYMPLAKASPKKKRKPKA